MGYGGERLCIDLAWGSFLVYENDGLPWYEGVVIHGRMPAIGVEHDGCARFRSEPPVAGHTLLKQRPGIRSGPALMACRHIGEFPAARINIIHIDLNFDMQRIGVGYIRVPTRVTERPRRQHADCLPQEHRLTIGEVPEAPVVAGVIDNIYKDFIFLDRVWDIEVRRLLLASLDPLKPVRLALVRPIIKGILQPPQFIVLDGVCKYEIPFFIPLHGLCFGRPLHDVILLPVVPFRRNCRVPRQPPAPGGTFTRDTAAFI